MEQFGSVSVKEFNRKVRQYNYLLVRYVCHEDRVELVDNRGVEIARLISQDGTHLKAETEIGHVSRVVTSLVKGQF